MNERYRIATFNVENFYLLLDRDYSLAEFAALDNGQVQAMNASIYNPNKELDKIQAIASIIVENDFDLVCLVEVGGMETLRNFNRYYLAEAYDCLLHEENSRRGIFVGALLKKGRFGPVAARNAGAGFSRNLLELKLRLDGRPFTFLLVHLKSQAGSEGGIAIRQAEVAQLCRIARTRNCVVMGDFNGILVPGMQQFEFEPFLALPFRDVLEALGLPVERRATHFYFDPRPSFNQLDYIFCSNDVQILDGGVLCPFVPANFDERRWLPSDHALVHATIRPGRGVDAAAPGR